MGLLAPFRILLALVLLTAIVPGASAAGQELLPEPVVPGIDVSAERAAPAAARTAFAEARRELARTRVASVRQTNERFALPTLVEFPASAAVRDGLARGPVLGRAAVEGAARDAIGRVAPLWRLGVDDVRTIALRAIHDTGRGGVIAAFRQEIAGVPVFRDEMRVLLGRDLAPRSVSGFVPARGLARADAARAWAGGSEAALAAARADFGPAALTDPPRVERRWFHAPDGLVAAWWIEFVAENDARSYVVAAADAAILFRNSLVADAFSYRVWADLSAPYAPFDGPQGTAPSPHPTGAPNWFEPAFVAPVLAVRDHTSATMSDPWLAPGATVTNGNNSDAYVDLASPDGLTGSDFRATTTAPGVFDRTYDVAQDPHVSTNQRMAAITQLFYDTNWMHDWYYDAGFTEAWGNGQKSNYGRGGLENDDMRVEAQDYSGLNNANMSTPSDGARSRMQMYVFSLGSTNVRLTISSPPSIAGEYVAARADFGPTSFDLSGTAEQGLDGAGNPLDGCSPLVNAVAGKVVLLDRSAGCSFVSQAQAAQAAGATAVIIVDDIPGSTTPTVLTGAGALAIPALCVTQSVGDAIQAALGAGVGVRVRRGLETFRDGTIDNQIVAHEWGHFISNRLVGDANGLSTNMARGMGEGWADFHALLMTVRAEDALVAGNTNWEGAYPIASYARDYTVQADESYYFGIRRVPYSVDPTRNALTFRHIANGQALPLTHPVAFGADGANNATTHRTGETWCSMLWECYVSLLRDSGRLTFDEARTRMRDYVVAGYKLTPNAPTLLEARDAILAAAAAADPADHALMAAAFARRGAGTGAIAPDRFSNTNIPVVESFVVAGEVDILSVRVEEGVANCDGDGYLDDGEFGEVVVEVRNVGAVALAGATLEVSSPEAGVFFPDGASFALPSAGLFETVEVRVPVGATGLGARTAVAFDVTVADPSFLAPGTVSGSGWAWMHVDEATGTTDDVEATATAWTLDAGSGGLPWERSAVAVGQTRLAVIDPGSNCDRQLVTPAIQVGPDPFTFAFDHAWSFESDGGTHYDGGVIEYSVNGGSWFDVANLVAPGYTGSLAVGGGNPIQGRSAYTATSPGWPALATRTLAFGNAFAGQSVRFRFRLGADVAVGAPGWLVDDVVVTGATVAPFTALVDEPDACVPVAVGDPDVPNTVELALAGRQPVTGVARLDFALPAAGPVLLTVHDVRGRRIDLLASGTYPAGRHTATWRGGAAGVYFARLSAGGTARVERIVRIAP